ncbi:hypothetical protein NEOLEDRAFT_817533 [Neolentinus lepideus HHB14362 ss-1]|uniref:Uncharacterized protein n=1 Tax=Neolentinus lepideus HHB14362 ss-1 TaxID=1314782 RepID=A0A165PDD3_9AGAM|nr:hypothetical protein NEOLEDRAFT_817533 [Neolentinus lepideus HHB14362 ss-1]
MPFIFPPVRFSRRDYIDLARDIERVFPVSYSFSAKRLRGDDGLTVALATAFFSTTCFLCVRDFHGKEMHIIFRTRFSCSERIGIILKVPERSRIPIKISDDAEHIKIQPGGILLLVAERSTQNNTQRPDTIATLERLRPASFRVR